MFCHKRSHLSEKPAYHNEEQCPHVAKRESLHTAMKTPHSKKEKKKKYIYIYIARNSCWTLQLRVDQLRLDPVEESLSCCGMTLARRSPAEATLRWESWWEIWFYHLQPLNLLEARLILNPRAMVASFKPPPCSLFHFWLLLSCLTTCPQTRFTLFFFIEYVTMLLLCYVLGV